MTKFLKILLVGVLLMLGSVNPTFAFKAAMVTDLTGLSGHGFNDIAWQGFKSAEKEFGINIRVVESKAPSDYIVNLRKLVEEDYDVIVGVGFLLKDAIEQEAKEFPNTSFVLIDDVTSKVYPNVRCYTFRENESSFLVGYLAAMMEQKGEVGFIGGMDIPLVRKFEAGYRAGVKTANSEIHVISAYTGSFTDSIKGEQLARTLFAQGVYNIYAAAGESGLGAIKAVKSMPAGYYFIGVDVDEDSLAPGKVLTSALKNVDMAVLDAIELKLKDNFRGGFFSLGLKENGVGITQMKFTRDKIPLKVLDNLSKLEEMIIKGKLKVPTTLDEVKSFIPPSL